MFSHAEIRHEKRAGKPAFVRASGTDDDFLRILSFFGLLFKS